MRSTCSSIPSASSPSRADSSTTATPLDELPDGAFVLRDDVPWLVLGSQLVRWTAAGYVDPSPRPSGEGVVLITPPSLVAILGTGWRGVVPLLHPSAS